MATQTRAIRNTGAQIVVALGGSGGSAGGLEQCLALLEVGASTAVVLIFHQREALDVARLQQALRGHGRRLTTIEDGQLIEGGNIYLHDPGVIVTAEDGHFQVRPSQQEPGARGTIDSFLVSLARNEDGQGIAALFGNTGGDGTLGAAAIKEWGGLTLAEETDETRTGSLAATQGPAALADVILPAREIAARITGHIAQLTGTRGKTELPGQSAAALASIVAVLRNKTGHDFHGYKQGTFWRRVQRRLQVNEAASVDEYLGILRSSPDEAQNLFNDLLIGVTQFFRDAKEFELLAAEIIPRLFEGKGRNENLRVWVIGCSTGEEAYSLSILLREHMATLEDPPQVQVFATDLDGLALASARAGRYTDSLVKDVSPERLARWFLKQGNTYLVVKELREMCIFSPHSLIKDAPFSRLDMISCRNLLIYLSPEMQTKVIPLFHFSLKSGGFLFLGNSENVSRHTSLFEPVENRSRIFRRLETDRRVLPDFPFPATDRRNTSLPSIPPTPATLNDLPRAAERVAERHAPAYVIVEQDGNVIHFSGRTGRYIEPAGGFATLNLLNLAHPDLRMDLRSALDRAIQTQQAVRVSNLRLNGGGGTNLVDLVVEPVPDGHKTSPYYVVLFKDGVPVLPHDASESEAGNASSERVHQLEAELRTASERLQATVEELESTNEELKSANEEYQSLNEELQSANEELETSKEELQSINEELTTVNGELAHRVQELGRANSDLKNFFENTQIATVFLDHDLKVMNYTPAVADIFPLVSSDLGRPIAHIKSQLPFDSLQEDATRVLRTLTTVERELANPVSGARYIMRVLPYRSIDNFIAGVVMTFVDITQRKHAEEALRDREERFRLILESARDYAIFTTNLDGVIEEWPAGASAVFGWTAEEAVGQNAAIVYVPEDRKNRVLESELARVKSEGFAENVRWHLRKDGTRVFIEGSVRALKDGSGQTRGALKIGQDVTERRRADAALGESEARFRAVADLVPELLWKSDPSGSTAWLNRRWFEYTGQTLAEAQDWGWTEAIHPDEREEAQRIFKAGMQGDEMLQHQHRIRRHDGEYRWFLVRAQAAYDAAGSVSQWFVSATDIQDQQTALAALQEGEAQAKLLLAELQHRVRNTLAVVRSIARRTALTSKSVEDYAMHLDGRLNAFARVQAAVTRHPQHGVDFGYLLAEELGAHMAREGEQVDVLTGPEILLQPKAAELLGLVVHELTINAVKYGALGSDDGHLRVQWEFDDTNDERVLEITWTETGVPIDMKTITPPGFGTELLERTLAYELGGESRTDFTADGVVCVIRLPVNDRLIAIKAAPGGGIPPAQRG